MQQAGILEEEEPMPQEGIVAEESPQAEEQEDDDGDPASNPAYGKAMDTVLAKLYDEDVADGIAAAINASQDKSKAIVEQAKLLEQAGG